MSQVRKTSFTILALMFAASSLVGCGISGPLYEVKTVEDTRVSDQETKPVNTDSK